MSWRPRELTTREIEEWHEALKVMTTRRHGMRDFSLSSDIVSALRNAGAQVIVLDWPCELLVRKSGRILLFALEGPKPDKQWEFLRDWEVPRVSTPAQALELLGE
jgi:hypothetical protein